ncbi:MAG: phosphate acyltransferase PlsX [Planctomycetota bacterium]|nr:phosphate acyltransferase PlsX [Planctomycetota bacterium]
MRLAVDVMGGDHAPDAILKGCIEALASLAPDDRLVLVGPRNVIQEVLDDRGIQDPRLEIEHADQVIAMHDPAALAVKSKRDSSIVRMCELGSHDGPAHANGNHTRADVVLSAGNTGACVAAAIMKMRRLPFVHRPGIAVTIPAFHGPVVLIDAGANPEPKPAHLWQYAIMAETLAQRLHGIERPRVALLNVGSEEIKGTDAVKQTRDLLRATPGLNYIGFVEGRDFFEGVADVIVTNGFVGNTLLKMAEGLAKSLFNAIAKSIIDIDPMLALKLEPVVKKIYQKNDYHEYGGAPLLGVNGACFIAHGSSEARTIRAAIRNCRAYVNAGVNEAIVKRLGEVTPAVSQKIGDGAPALA